MPIGSMLIGDLLNSSYTPQVDATHYKPGEPDEDGNPTPGKFYKDDGQGNMVLTTLYNQPNMFQRIVSPEARQYAGMNAQATASPLLAQQQHDMLRSNVGTDVNAVPPNQWGNPGDLNASISDILQPSLSPAGAVPQAKSRGALNTGLLGQTAATETEAQNVGANIDLGQSQFNLENLPKEHQLALQNQANQIAQATDNTPEEIRQAQQHLLWQKSQIPTIEETQDALNRYARSQALFSGNEQGLQQGTQHLQNLAENYNAGMIPKRGVSTPFAASVGMSGVSELPGVSPDYINTMAAMSAKLGGINGKSRSLVNGPSGGTMPRPTNVPPQTYSGQPLIGKTTTNGATMSTDYLNDAMDYTPLSSNPDILVNPKTQRAVYKPTGADITEQVNSNPALVHTIAQEIKDKQDKDKSDQEKVLKAQHTLQMNSLKKQQDVLAAQRPYGGAIGLNRDAGNAIGNTLIGNAASYLGDATSNLHPYDYLNDLDNKAYNVTKRLLIGNQ